MFGNRDRASLLVSGESLEYRFVISSVECPMSSAIVYNGTPFCANQDPKV